VKLGGNGERYRDQRGRADSARPQYRKDSIGAWPAALGERSRNNKALRCPFPDEVKSLAIQYILCMTKGGYQMAEIVYVLSNASMPGLLKIGRTDKKDVTTRMKKLYTTGVPVAFDCVYACRVPDNEEVEKLLHERFSKNRINLQREFFKITAMKAVKALKEYELEDLTPALRSKFDAILLDEEKEARWKERRKAIKNDPSVALAKDLHETVKKRPGKI
jgi:hypothetical protein